MVRQGACAARARAGAVVACIRRGAMASARAPRALCAVVAQLYQVVKAPGSLLLTLTVPVIDYDEPQHKARRAAGGLACGALLARLFNASCVRGRPLRSSGIGCSTA